jgi:N-acetyl-gamma-glutamyl-phosphate reductase
MTARRVGVVGASGYSGAVAARILALHPDVELVGVTSDKLSGRSLRGELGLITGPDVRFVPNAAALDMAAGCDAVLLATSAEVSASLAPRLVAAGKLVVDLSGAFRLPDVADYPRWYGFEHPTLRGVGHEPPVGYRPGHYGLPELFGPPPLEPLLVANPGCYPTATLLALGPLVREGLVEPAGLIVDAKSGVTGAGRQAKEDYSFGEVSGDTRPYKLLSHQHTPEIAAMLSRFRPATLTFTAHLLPVRRGLLATCYGRPRPGATATRVRECLADAYRGKPFVEVVTPAEVTLKSVAGTNLARVGAVANDDIVVAVGAIDNLLKGAAGQAVQNLNLALGLPETAGLAGLQRFAP